MSASLCDIIITFRINIIFLGEFMTVTVDFPSSSAKPAPPLVVHSKGLTNGGNTKKGVNDASVMHPNILRWFPLSLSEDFKV